MSIKPRDIYIIRDMLNENQRTVVYGEQLREKCAPHVAKALSAIPYNSKSGPTRLGNLSVTKTQTMG